MKSRSWTWVVVALAAHFVALAYFAPIGGDDWLALVGPSHDLASAVHGALVTADALHVVLTPLGALALVYGVATLALGRWCDPRRPDGAFAFALASALVWVAAPRAGFVYSHRGAAATELYASALCVWLAIAMAHVDDESDTPARAVACWFAGFFAAALARPLGPAACVVAAAFAATRAEGRATRWSGVAGLAVGAMYAWWAAPAHELERVLAAGGQAWVHAAAGLLRPATTVAAATLAVVWIQIIRGRIAAKDDATLAAAAWATLFALGVAGAASAGAFPLSQDAFAAGVAVAVIGTRVGCALASDRGLARVVVAGVVIVHVWVGYDSLVALVPAQADAQQRWHELASAREGSLATLSPFRRYRGGAYTIGEDFQTSEVRDRVATRWFALRGAVIEPSVYGQDRAAQLELREVTDAHLRRWYSADVATAREQLAEAYARSPNRPHALSLVASGLGVPDRPGVPVEVAWLDGGRIAGTTFAPAPADWLGRVRVRVTPAARDVWAIELGGARTLRLEPDGARDGTTFAIPLDHHASYALVACDAHCALGRVIQIE